MTYTARTEEVQSVSNIDLGTTDKRGRRVGVRVTRAILTYVAHDRQGGYTRAPGTYFGFLGEATRDGKVFGALQNYRPFDTEAECEKEIAKYLKGAKARAAKAS